MFGTNIRENVVLTEKGNIKNDKVLSHLNNASSKHFGQKKANQ